MLKEVIVVEGRDDIVAVKRALDCDLIATGGFGFPKGVEERIKSAHEKRGVIVFTDPDYAGEKIRKKVSQIAPGCKHAFLPREEATKNGDIGIENASPESILAALSKIRTESIERGSIFSNIDLVKNNLVGTNNSQLKRDLVGRILGIGYGNSKQFLNRLNSYGVTREEFESALRTYDENEGKTLIEGGDR